MEHDDRDVRLNPGMERVESDDSHDGSAAATGSLPHDATDAHVCAGRQVIGAEAPVMRDEGSQHRRRKAQGVMGTRFGHPLDLLAVSLPESPGEVPRVAVASYQRRARSARSGFDWLGRPSPSSSAEWSLGADYSNW